MIINNDFVRRPLVYKQWNLHIDIQKQLSELNSGTLCKIFSAGVSNALFSALRSYGNN